MTLPALSLETSPTLLELFNREIDDPIHFQGPAGEQVAARWWDAALAGPLREFLGRPGKELRARWVEAGARLGGGTSPLPPELPLLIEMLHAGSLIVDDIEDASGSRRGARALHCLFGVPKALNAGNWMYFWPEIVMERLGLPVRVELELRRAFARSLLRCHNGQALDLSIRVVDLDPAEVRDVVMTATSLKTGSLVELAFVSGAIASGAPANRIRAVADLGRAIGVGLQMFDDLSGLLSDRRRHKGHEDLVHARPTWPWAWVASSTPADAYRSLTRLGRQVAARDRHPEHLSEALRAQLGPDPKAWPRTFLSAAVERAASALGPHPELATLRADLKGLDKSYD